MQMAKDAALGINWLHEAKPPITHGSLTPNNLLVDTNLHVKVSDFGMSNIKRIFGVNPLSHPQKNLETLIWLPPEILEGKSPTEKGDVYSFGLVLWMLITLEKPFSECLTFEKLKEAIVNNKQRPQIPYSCPTMLKGLITSCWADDPSSRPSFKQVIMQLDQMIVETAIPHSRAATFWRNNFSDMISVDWTVFINALETEIKLHNNLHPIDNNLIKTSSTDLEEQKLQKIKCLQSLAVSKELTSSGKERVHIEKFGWIVSWFGSINQDFLEKVHSVIYSPWFHGDISAKTSETLLQQKNPGTFLVRLSTYNFGSYVLSFVSQSYKVNHQRFSYDPQNNVFVLSDKQYPTITALLDASITSFHLSVPCLGSKYTSLYTEVESKGYIGNRLENF